MADTTIMSADSLKAFNRTHGIVGGLLAALVALLPMFTSIGPNSWKKCGAEGAAMPAAVPPAVTPPVSPAPAASVPAAVATTPAPAPAPAVVANDVPPAARVYFALDRFNVPGGVDTTLAQVVSYLKSHPAATAAVVGFHDERGSAEHNAMLANNRARSVRARLQRMGIAASRIATDKPQMTVGSGTYDEARRVEVSVKP
jgi:outer membrane protein OmpA-like peptidoglycan-associated protein